MDSLFCVWIGIVLCKEAMWCILARIRCNGVANSIFFCLNFQPDADPLCTFLQRVCTILFVQNISQAVNTMQFSSPPASHKVGQAGQVSSVATIPLRK